MTPREIIAEWLNPRAKPRSFVRHNCEQYADDLIAALAAAGLTIVADGDDHGPTWERAMDAAAKEAATGSCPYNLGWDRETGPLGCLLDLREGCVCCGVTLAIRSLKTAKGGNDAS